MQRDEIQTGSSAPRLIVGVGASAGGLDALKGFFGALPSESGMVFLLVQHMGAGHESRLVEILASYTQLRVVRAENGATLQPDTIYVSPPGAEMSIRGGRLAVSVSMNQRGRQRTVDQLFLSLAREYRTGAAGVVLSGGGSDGTAGLRALKAAGSLTIAQQPETATQPGMPQSAIDAGVVDLALPPAEIPKALARFADLPPDARDEAIDAPPHQEEVSEEALSRLAAILLSHSDFDLKHYKPATIRRRVLRRMGLAGFDTLEPYLLRLQRDEHEQQALIHDFRIGVTEFFRNPEAFEELRTRVIVPLVSETESGGTIRVWVPGCATGEEAYSIAILLLEACDARRKTLGIQIFATDVDEGAIAVARAGVYPPSQAERLSEERRRAFFSVLPGGSLQVRARLRDIISFAVHDLCKNPPFSRMDLVSCRNLLIYLRPEAQEQVLGLLHFALKPGGALFLGTSESVGAQRNLFTTLSREWHIFRKLGATRPMSLSRLSTRRQGESPRAPVGISSAGARPGTTAQASTSEMAREALLEGCVPPSVVVSESDQILYMHGDLTPYLHLPRGEPRLELVSVLRKDLVTRARAALYKCRRDHTPVTVFSSPDAEGAPLTRITIRPAPPLGQGAVSLTFENAGVSTEAQTTSPDSPEQETLIGQLERELMATREDLRHTVEELESSNEELRAAHEESMSMNEELQSANEELEVTTEELRSLNEELATVNNRLRDKIDQLTQAHNDLENVFASARVAILFLDEELRVKRFTPATEEFLHLGPADKGRFVGDLARELLQTDLVQESQAVLQNLSPISRELHTSQGRWFIRRILPYRTENQRIEGVVVSFLDVTELKQATERLAIREKQQAVIARLGLRALVEEDLEKFMEQTVREVQQTLGTDFCELLELQPGRKELLLRAGVGWKEGYVGVATVGAGLDSQAGYTLEIGEPVIVEDLATEKRFSGPPLLIEHGAISGISCAIQDGEGPYGVMGVHTTRRRQFTTDDANFLQAVAAVVANAISRKLARQRLAVERATARVLSEAKSMKEAAPRLLAAFAHELDISLSELWMPRADSEALICEEFLVSGIQEHQDELTHFFHERSFRKGEGLVGSVWQQKKALWMTEAGEGEEFRRTVQARKLGLISGFAFPILVGHEVLGVMSFFSQKRLIPDNLFLHSLEALSRAIGEFAQRREFERRLRESEEKARRETAELEAIYAALPVGLSLHDRQHRFLKTNPKLAEIGGLLVEAPPEGSDLALSPDLKENVNKLIDQVFETGEPIQNVELSSEKSEGNTRYFLCSYAPVKDETGHVWAVSCVVQDITERKHSEQVLKEASNQKDLLLAMLGHELRNPLAAIRSAAELLQRLNLEDPKLQRIRSILHRQTAHAAKLLDGLLDVSRIVRGKITLDREVLVLGSLIRDLLQDRMEQIESQGLSLSTHFSEEPLWVEGDRVRLMQIFDNLLTNAIRFTPSGGKITVCVTREERDALVRIKDTGAGIEPKFLPYIFEPFQQAAQSLDRATGGLGLGLALVRGLIELHGGSVYARSEGVGKGAEFVARIPLVEGPRQKPTVEETKIPGQRVLIVEDIQDTAEALKDVLEEIGYKVAIAFDGPQALERIKEFQPDAILCDIGLPGEMNGFDVARSVRNDPQQKDIFLIALTGYGRPEDKALSKEAGFDEHLTKPADLATIERLLARGRKRS